jgi:polysaccharide export outer membrane protein
MKCRSFLAVGALTVMASLAPAQGPALATDVNHQPLSDTARASTAPAFAERNPRYRLRPGDTFDLDFALTPEFNQTVSVQPDGYASLRSVGDIPVEGKTIPELRDLVITAYSHVLHGPVIVIALKDFDKPYFIATGQVAKPGKYDLRSDLSITEALAVAGGASDKAKLSEVVLYRKTPAGNFEGKVYNIKKLLSTRNLSEDARLLPGDLLYVPQNRSSHLRPFLPTASMGAFYSPVRY